MWDYQVLGVSVVGVHNGSGFGQGSEVLLGGGSVVWIKRSHGAVGIEDKLGLGGGQNSGQYLGRRRALVLCGGAVAWWCGLCYFSSPETAWLRQ